MVGSRAGPCVSARIHVRALGLAGTGAEGGGLGLGLGLDLASRQNVVVSKNLRNRKKGGARFGVVLSKRFPQA